MSFAAEHEGHSGCAVDVRDLRAGYNSHVALEGVTFTIETGCLAGLVGPNGSGKSTLLKVMLGLHKPWSGEVLIFGHSEHPTHGHVGYTPQTELVDWTFPVTVMDVVLMGRYGKLGLVRRPGRRDHELAEQALERVHLSDRAGRQIGELSGGEQRRALIARALAQEADLLLLDEPLAGLDATAQHDLLPLLEELRTERQDVIRRHPRSLMRRRRLRPRRPHQPQRRRLRPPRRRFHRGEPQRRLRAPLCPPQGTTIVGS